MHSGRFDDRSQCKKYFHLSLMELRIIYSLGVLENFEKLVAGEDV